MPCACFQQMHFWLPILGRSLLLLITHTGKWPNLWQALHWYFLAGHWNPSIWVVSPHFEHLGLSLCAPFVSNLFLGCACGWNPSLPWCLWFTCLGFIGALFFLYFPAGNSVHWCLRRFICAACGSPATCLIWHAVALELSSFWASCLTLLAGNFSRSTLPSLMVLETKSSSLRKNQKMSLCIILAVSGGI